MAEVANAFHYGEDTFTAVKKELEVLDRLVQGAEVRGGTLIDEFPFVFELNMKREQVVNEASMKLVHSAYAGGARLTVKDLCSNKTFPQSLKSLKELADAFPLLKNLVDVTGLKSVSVAIKNEVMSMTQMLRRVVVTADKVETALNDEIRIAREESKRSQCVPLFEQFFSPLSDRQKLLTTWCKARQVLVLPLH
ncbi:hypothetical protein ERJ75_001707800 [Trypanosoma vivax]|nr:hypothetical protein ERJ75_001707800 [Trypanosoma vivax]